MNREYIKEKIDILFRVKETLKKYVNVMMSGFMPIVGLVFVLVYIFVAIEVLWNSDLNIHCN